VDVLHYVFRLTLSDESDAIVGEATVDVRFLENGLKGFALDLTSAASGKGMSVSSVTSPNASVRFEHKDHRLKIVLDPPATAGQRRSLQVTYGGIPGAGLRIGKNRHGERTFFSENWPDKARGWLPAVDHPDYYRRYRDGNASTADFQRVMEEHVRQDLTWFFRQWLYRAGSPELDGSWRYDVERKRIEVELSQLQPGDPYRLPIELGIATDESAEPRIEKIELKERQGRFEFRVEKEPAAVTLDPNCWVLMKSRFKRPASPR
jgi:aminopeptidase N